MKLSVVSAFGMLAASAGYSAAAIIVTSPAPAVSGAGTASVLVVTGSPNNDNATAPGGTITITGKNFTSIGPIDIVFTVAGSGGTTEYFASEGVTNSTGQSWIGYGLELGFGTGSSFVRSAATDLLDFDTPDVDPTPAFSAFSTLAHGSDLILWTGGLVPNTQAVATSFSIDVPDGLSGFTLRQYPIIPEPATLGALGGLLAIARRRR